MRKIQHFMSEHPMVILVFGFLVITLLAVIFQYSLITGFVVGSTEGKVYSISEKPLGGNNRSAHKVDFAKVKLKSGKFVQVQCISYCRLDQKLNITIYKRLWGNKLRNVYERT
ncbi:hypothetical protein [Alteromonas sp. ASW11-130]|uniref:hypothetical protein n=1 Tax=Alteromonas sp. ASW11-130 TaxID=3015775 RepID=UPI0022420040|nr:hypothetical protein [Alteromonas sp. ASW11-130]MCW8092252.1 hypothetical protein [Alteromonas sp. ASW11-130]